jgi:hypothetical protein
MLGGWELPATSRAASENRHKPRLRQLVMHSISRLSTHPSVQRLVHCDVEHLCIDDKYEVFNMVKVMEDFHADARLRGCLAERL